MTTLLFLSLFFCAVAGRIVLLKMGYPINPMACAEGEAGLVDCGMAKMNITVYSELVDGQYDGCIGIALGKDDFWGIVQLWKYAYSTDDDDYYTGMDEYLTQTAYIRGFPSFFRYLPAGTYAVAKYDFESFFVGIKNAEVSPSIRLGLVLNNHTGV